MSRMPNAMLENSSVGLAVVWSTTGSRYPGADWSFGSSRELRDANNRAVGDHDLRGEERWRLKFTITPKGKFKFFEGALDVYELDTRDGHVVRDKTNWRDPEPRPPEEFIEPQVSGEQGSVRSDNYGLFRRTRIDW